MIADYLEELKAIEADDLNAGKFERLERILKEFETAAKGSPQEFIEAIVTIPMSEGTFLLWDDLLNIVFSESVFMEYPLLQKFFLRELDRLLELAKDDKSALESVGHFDRISGLDGSQLLQQQVRERLYRGLDSPNAWIRRECAETLSFFIGEDSEREMSRLERMLESDPDWRNRCVVYGILTDLTGKRRRLSILDRLRGRVLR